MKVKLDENIPASVATLLRSLGVDATTVLREELGGADDDRVLAAATTEGRVALTLDRGFGDMRRHHGVQHEGIVVLRPHQQDPASVQSLLRSFLAWAETEEVGDAVMVVQADSIRIRRAGSAARGSSDP